MKTPKLFHVSRALGIFYTVCIILLIAICYSLIQNYYVFQKNNLSKKFATSRYAPYAYQIAPDPISKGALPVLTNFELQKKMISSTLLEVKIRPRGHYKWKTFRLTKGYRLYFAILPDAEGEFNDTSTLDYLNYDIPVLVDNTGAIVKTP